MPAVSPDNFRRPKRWRNSYSVEHAARQERGDEAHIASVLAALPEPRRPSTDFFIDYSYRSCHVQRELICPVFWRGATPATGEGLLRYGRRTPSTPAAAVLAQSAMHLEELN